MTPSKESADLLIFPRWLLPMAQARAVLSNHAVAVSAGRIVAVGPAQEIAARFASREHVTRADHVLLPGFVNAHTRASLSLLRGLPVHGPIMRWLRETVAPAELRSVSPDFVREGTQLAIAEMLRAGITCFADSYLFPDEAARVASEARVRAVIGLPVADVADTLVFSATRQQVSDVWVAGHAAVQDGRLLAFDEQEMVALGRSWAERIQLGVAA